MISDLSLFANEHPLLTGLAFILIYFGFVSLTSRIIRSINILFRGWPPSHLDGDGAWRTSNKGTEEGVDEKVS